MSLSRFRAPLAALALFAAPCAIASADDTPSITANGPFITVVTHFDIIPTYLTQAQPLLEQFVIASRSDPGIKYFTMITWAPTTNHFQLLEVYDSLAAFNNHVTAAHTIAFRTAVQPYIGAPIDERLYLTNPSFGP
jgi:quinol monooxygenase YgiN